MFEALEERKLLAADVALPSLDFAFASAASEVRVTLPDAPPDVRFAASRELAIVDGAVPDLGAVVAALHREQEPGRRIDVVLIDPERDGIAQVSAALARRGGIDALHFVSHGESGAIRLGSTRLDLAALAARGEAIGEWSRALAPGADLLVYGCDVAATDAGEAWLEALVALTGADVAASENRTGASALGGDWVLETHRGDVGTAVALDPAALVGWQAVLATETLDWNAAPSAPLPETQPNTYVETYARGPGTVTLTVSDPSGRLRPEDTPAVTGRLTGGMSAAQRSLRLNAQAGFAPGESATVALTFAGYPGGVSDVRILLLDIDTSNGGGGFVDQVEVSANGTLAPTQVRLGADAAVAAGESTPVQDSPPEPYVTFDGARTLTGRFAGNLPITSEPDGEANAADGAANGNAWIRFGQSGISSVSFVYRNARGASGQGIGIYNVLFDVPEVVATADLATTAKNAALSVPPDGVLANDTDSYPGPGGSPTVARVNGTVVAAGPAGTTVSLASGARVTMREDGSYDYDPNGAFDTLAPGATTTESFQYTLSDQAAPTPNTAIATVTITITSPDLPPALDGLGTLAYTEKDAPTVVVRGATLYDPDAAAYPGGSLAVAFAFNGSAEDQLSIRSTGTAAGEIGVSGTTVTFGGVAIGTFSGGVSGAPLVVAFDAGATPSAVQALLRAVTYANSSTNPSILPRTLAFSLDDGAGGTAAATVSVTVIGVNDAPIATGAATLAPVAENTASPPGAALAALFAPCYDDSRDGSAATPLAGVAIVANASRASEGRWQYSADGATWSNLPAAGLADTAALVLPATVRLRFVPVPDWNGTPGGLTLRLADASSGPVVPQAGADIGSGVGGSGAWSAGTVTLDTIVTAQNDPPVLVRDRLAVAEGGVRTIGPEALLALDPEQGADALVFALRAAPAHGTLLFDGREVAAEFRFTQADVAAGRLAYRHDGSETRTDAVRIDLVDGAGAVLAGRTLAIDIAAIDDAPVMIAARLYALPGEPLAEESASAVASASGSLSTTGDAGFVDPSVQSFLRPPSVPASLPGAVVSADASRAAAPPTGRERLSDGEAFEAQRVTVADAAILFSPPETSTMTHAEYSVEVISTRGIDLDRERSSGELDLDSVRLTGMVLSVGFVWWAMRATGLLASLLASAPAWRHLDPLPVLGGARRGSVEWVAPPDVDAQREEQAAAPVLEEARDDRA